MCSITSSWRTEVITRGEIVKWLSLLPTKHKEKCLGERTPGFEITQYYSLDMSDTNV